MSLLDEAFESFTIINKQIIDDGYGGVVTEWVDGATIKGAIVFNSSSQVHIAQALGSTSTYTFIVRKEIELDYHTVLKQVDTGRIFRLTSNSDDMKTPKSAGLNMREYDAEEWTLA